MHQESEPEEDEKVTVARFTGSGPIDLGSYSGDEMNIATFGIPTDGPIDLGFDSSNETKISSDVVPKTKRAPNVAWLQEIEEINQRVHANNIELKRLLQEEKKEKQRLQHQLQDKEEALEKLQHNQPKVKSESSFLCTFHHHDFATFKRHTTGIGSKLLKKMGCQGKGLGINGQGIVNPIKVEELPRYVGLGYVNKEVEECSKTASDQPMTDDERTSSHSS